jgi:hypothetical protein
MVSLRLLSPLQPLLITFLELKLVQRWALVFGKAVDVLSVFIVPLGTKS